jgi:hypothetical protein
MAKLKNKKLNQFVVTNDLKVTLENIIVEDDSFECSVYVDGEYAFEVFNGENKVFNYEIKKPDLFRKVINFIDDRLIEDDTRQYKPYIRSFKVLENIINKELGLV